MQKKATVASFQVTIRYVLSAMGNRWKSYHENQYLDRDMNLGTVAYNTQLLITPQRCAVQPDKDEVGNTRHCIPITISFMDSLRRHIYSMVRSTLTNK